MPNAVQLMMKLMDGVSLPARNMTRGLGGFRNEVSNTERELKQAGGQRKAITKFKLLSRGIIANRQALSDARAELARHQQALSANGKPTQKMLNQHKRLAAGVAALESKVKSQTTEMKKQKAVLRDAGMQTRHLATADAELARRESALTDELRRKRTELEKHQTAYKNAQAAKERFGKRMELGANATLVGHGAARVVRGGINLFTTPYKDSLKYLSALEDIGITAGITAQQQKELGKQTRQTARETNQSVDDLLEAQQIMIERGLTAGQASGARGGVAQVATATKSAPQEIAKTSGALIENLDILPGKLKSVFDGLSFLGKKGGFELRDMAQYFPELTGGLDAINFKGQRAVFSLGAALQVARTQAGSSAEAANNTKNFLQKLTAPRTIKNFKKFGVDLKAELSDAIQSGGDPIEFMLRRIGDLAGDVQTIRGQSVIGELFGDMQVLSFLKPALANLDDFVALKNQAGQSQGLIDADFAERMKSDVASAREFGIAWADLKLGLGQGLLPILTPLVKGVTSMVNGLSRFSENNPRTMGVLLGLTAGVVGLAAVVAAIAIPLGSLIGGFALLSFAGGRGMGQIKGLWSAMRGGAGIMKSLSGGLLSVARVALPAVLTGVRALTLAFMSNPIGLALTGLSVGATAIYKNWDGIKKWFSGSDDSEEAGPAATKLEETVALAKVEVPAAKRQRGGASISLTMNAPITISGADASDVASIKAVVAEALREARDEMEAGLRSSFADLDGAGAF